MLNTYKVGPFTDVANLWGTRLWVFLNSKDIVNKMIEATNLNKTPAEFISTELLIKFGDEIKKDRVKQFTGFLIRQVMESNGYYHKYYGSPIKNKIIFKSGSKYSKKR